MVAAIECSSSTASATVKLPRVEPGKNTRVRAGGRIGRGRRSGRVKSAHSGSIATSGKRGARRSTQASSAAGEISTGV